MSPGCCVAAPGSAPRRSAARPAGFTTARALPTTTLVFVCVVCPEDQFLKALAPLILLPFRHSRGEDFLNAEALWARAVFGLVRRRRAECFPQAPVGVESGSRARIPSHTLVVKRAGSIASMGRPGPW